MKYLLLILYIFSGCSNPEKFHSFDCWPDSASCSFYVREILDSNTIEVQVKIHSNDSLFIFPYYLSIAVPNVGVYSYPYIDSLFFLDTGFYKATFLFEKNGEINYGTSRPDTIPVQAMDEGFLRFSKTNILPQIKNPIINGKYDVMREILQISSINGLDFIEPYQNDGIFVRWCEYSEFAYTGCETIGINDSLAQLGVYPLKMGEIYSELKKIHRKVNYPIRNPMGSGWIQVIIDSVTFDGFLQRKPILFTRFQS